MFYAQNAGILGRPSGNFVMTVMIDFLSDVNEYSVTKIVVSYPMAGNPNFGKFTEFSVQQCFFNEEVLITGSWKFGITDPQSPQYNNLADWYFSGNVLEVRVSIES